MKNFIPAVSLAVLATFSFSACDTPGQSALLGAGTGAIIGNESSGNPLRGAAIGAGVGYLVGKLVQADRRRSYGEGYYDSRADRYDDRGDRISSRRYPVARPTNRFGFVTSPYSPYNLIDVRGIPHGAQVIDPSRDRLFINP